MKLLLEVLRILLEVLLEVLKEVLKVFKVLKVPLLLRVRGLRAVRSA